MRIPFLTRWLEKRRRQRELAAQTAMQARYRSAADLGLGTRTSGRYSQSAPATRRPDAWPYDPTTDPASPLAPFHPLSSHPSYARDDDMSHYSRGAADHDTSDRYSGGHSSHDSGSSSSSYDSGSSSSDSGGGGGGGSSD